MVEAANALLPRAAVMAPPPDASAAEETPEQLISRGLSTAKTAAERTVSSAKALQDEMRRKKEAVPVVVVGPATALASVPRTPSTEAVQRVTMELDEALFAMEKEAAVLLKPPTRKRTVYGGAHAVEPMRGSKDTAATPAPRVYGGDAAADRRALALTTSRLSTPREAGVGLSGPARSQSAGWSRSPTLRRAAVPPPPARNLSVELAPLLSTSASSGALSKPSPHFDGLTPGQRALGARAADRLAFVRRQQAAHGPPIGLVMPPPPRIMRDLTVAHASARAEEDRRRRSDLERTTTRWLALAESDETYHEPQATLAHGATAKAAAEGGRGGRRPPTPHAAGGSYLSACRGACDPAGCHPGAAVTGGGIDGTGPSHKRAVGVGVGAVGVHGRGRAWRGSASGASASASAAAHTVHATHVAMPLASINMSLHAVPDAQTRSAYGGPMGGSTSNSSHPAGVKPSHDMRRAVSTGSLYTGGRPARFSFFPQMSEGLTRSSHPSRLISPADLAG